MQIVVKKINDKFFAIEPETNKKLTTVKPSVWGADSLPSEYEHPNGIYWNSLKEAIKELTSAGHRIDIP